MKYLSWLHYEIGCNEIRLPTTAALTTACRAEKFDPSMLEEFCIQD